MMQAAWSMEEGAGCTDAAGLAGSVREGPSHPRPMVSDVCTGALHCRNSLRSPKARLLAHCAMFGWFAFVWCWHLSEDASKLPGAQGFGWFVRYLTFYSYTLQTAMLGLATLNDLCCQHLGSKLRWAALVDDLACALFGLAHVVTIMFYTIQATTKDAVEGGHIQRPPWLDVSVHVLNTAAVWVDLLTAPSAARTFSRSSERLSSVCVLGYLGYILLCRRMNGRFPYPFLNRLPMPWGFVGIVGACLCIFFVMFRVGRVLARRVQAVEVRWAAMGESLVVRAESANAGGLTGRDVAAATATGEAATAAAATGSSAAVLSGLSPALRRSTRRKA